MLNPMVRSTLALAAIFLLCAAVTAQAPDPAIDSDQDGIADSEEQSLLEQFRPTFLIAAKDCAERPAQFASGSLKPASVARDGTIYGQVFPGPTAGTREIHYYTLWERDCGRNGHDLDVEHVSALLKPASPDQPRQWRAVFWYAGAHEDTICDTSNAVRAPAVAAEESGPRVWASSGKHALFLSGKLCGRGCGGDSCETPVELAHDRATVNLGELRAPMNGALWTGYKDWPLSLKMATDFPPQTISAIESAPADAPVSVAKVNRATRAMVLGGDSSLDGLASGAKHTGGALAVADEKTSKSLDKATSATGNSVGRAFKAAFRWITRSRPPADKQ